MAADARPHVVIAATDARATEATNQLEHLVALLSGPQRRVSVVLVGDGERLRHLRRAAPVVVADRYRSRGLGRVLAAVGLVDVAGRYKSLRVRRRVDRLCDATWIVLDPAATSFLRHASGRPSPLVAALIGPGARLDDVAPGDLDPLVGADLWLATTERQRAELAPAVAGPVVVTGDLYEPTVPHPLPPAGSDADPVVLSTPPDTWSSVAHTVEVATALRSRHPDLPLVWLADPGDDAWLARHDRDRAAPQGDPIPVVERRPDLGLRPRMVVRTGYAASDPDLAVASAFDAVPTVGFEVGDLPEVAGTAVAPFEVEALVDRVEALLDDGARAELGERCQAAIRLRLDTRHRLRPLFELLDRAAGGPTPTT